MLTEAKLSQAIPLEKPYKIYDADGLFAIVQPSGSLWWRYRYRLDGRDSSAAIGVYPAVSLLEARRRRDAAKRLVLTGIDPNTARREAKGQAAKAKADTFLCVSEEWLETAAKSLSDTSLVKYRWLLNKFLYPKLGDIPVNEITTPLVFGVLKDIEKTGQVHSAHQCKIRIAQIFRYARAKGIKTIDVSDDMRGGLIPIRTKNHPAITIPKELAPLLRDIVDYHGKPVTRLALQIAPLVFVRPYELRHVEWNEIDLDAGLWVIPVDKLKGRKNLEEKFAHIVPLATQTVGLLKQLQPLTGCYKYVFPNDKGCMWPMSNAALTFALDRMGYGDRQSWHGFRATARTIIEEVLGYDPKYPEMQLAHKVKDPNGRAYNRTAFLQQRREMMQTWADYLDKLRTGENSQSLL